MVVAIRMSWLAVLVAALLRAEPPPATVVPVDGEPVAVQGLKIAKGVVSGGAALRWPLEDLAAIQFRPENGRPPTERLAGPRVLFANGDVLAVGDLAEADGERLAVSGASFGKAELPLLAVAGVALLRTGSAADEARLVEWLARHREGDAVLLRNFDEAAGSFVGLTGSELRFERAGQSLAWPRDRILAIAFDGSLADKKPPAGVRLAVRLIDGSAVALAAPEFPAGERKALSGKHPGGFALALHPETVLEAEVLGGRVLQLSDAEPRAIERQPYLDDALPPRRDANARGGPLRLADRTFAKGWGTASGTRLAFDAAGRRRFECWVGVDDAAGPLASVRFLVRVDGTAKFDSGLMAVGEAPKPVRIDLAGAREIVLEAEFGTRGDADDLANWCDARLVK